MRILHSGTKYEISLPGSALDVCILDVKQAIITDGRIRPSSATTDVSAMKLILAGRILKDDDLVASLKIDRHSSITLLLGGVSGGRLAVPRQEQNRIIDDLQAGSGGRAKAPGGLPASSTALSSGSRFGRVEVLQGLAMHTRASALLHELANDPGIIAVMKKQSWRVGALCELYPEGQVGVDPVCVLGLNENAGQRILLRLRTDDLEGFRSMLSIRQTLCHELAHNVHSDHNDAFYMLMRTIERDVVALNWRKSTAHSLGGAGQTERYEPADVGAADTAGGSSRVYMLGSDEASAAAGDADLRSLPAREAAANAAMRRSREDLEMERSCGCSHPERSGEILRETNRRAFASSLPASDVCLPCPALEAIAAATESSESSPEARSGVELQPEANDPPTLPATTMKEVVMEEVPHAEACCDWQLISDAMLANVDEGIALCLSSESAATPIEQLFRIREAISRILAQGSNQDGPRQRLIQGISLLRLVIGNAKELGAADPKYREINTDGASWRNKLAGIPGARDLLLVSGFCAQGSKLVYARADTGLLYMCYEFLDNMLTIIDSQLFPTL